MMTKFMINKNRGAVVNRALKKRGLSAKRDSPALQQIYEKGVSDYIFCIARV